MTPTSPGTGILTTSGSKYNVFDNNNVVGNSNYGVRFKEAAVYTPVYENITNTNVSGSAVCVYKQNVNNTNISNGNLIQNCPTALIQSNNSGLDPIAFNIFKNSALGIHFNHVLDSEVHDNQFINVAVPILLEGTSGNTFSNNVGSGNGVGIIGMSPADTFTNNVIGELPATTVTCGQTLTTSTKLANSLKCAGNGLTLSGDNIFLACNSKSLTGVRNPTTLQLRGTGVAINGDNDAVSNCNITGFALAVDYGTGTGNVMANNKLSKNAKGVSFINYLLQAFINNDWDP